MPDLTETAQLGTSFFPFTYAKSVPVGFAYISCRHLDDICLSENYSILHRADPAFSVIVVLFFEHDKSSFGIKFTEHWMAVVLSICH